MMEHVRWNMEEVKLKFKRVINSSSGVYLSVGFGLSLNIFP